MSTKRNAPKSTPPAASTFVVSLAEVRIPEINPNQFRSSTDPWVKYGENNQFSDFLMKAVKKSTRHSAFINLRENLVKGAGITFSDNTKAFFENLDEQGTTLEELLEDVSTDLSILETFACFVRYNKTKTAIRAIDYVDSSKVRPAKIVQSDEAITAGELPRVAGYYVCADWSDTQRNVPVFYEAFNPADIRQTTQLYFYHKRANGQPYLPEVSYASCLNYVEMEYEMSKYGLSAMLNGFFGSAILSLNASISDEQKLSFQRTIRDTFTGTDNASKLMVTVTEKDNAITVTPINTTDNTPMLKAFCEMAESAIATAHRCQPVLAGIQSQSSTLGSDGKLIKSAQELYQKNVICHLQKPFLSFLKKVLRFNKVTEYDLQIQSLNLVSEDVPDWFLQDHVRPEVLAAKYGFKTEDLIQDAPPNGVAPVPTENPYPANVQ